MVASSRVTFPFLSKMSDFCCVIRGHTTTGGDFQRRHGLAGLCHHLLARLHVVVPRVDLVDVHAGRLHDVHIVVHHRGAYVERQPVVDAVLCIDGKAGLHELVPERIDDVIERERPISPFRKLGNLLISMSEMSGAPTPDWTATSSLLCMSSYGERLAVEIDGFARVLRIPHLDDCVVVVRCSGWKVHRVSFVGALRERVEAGDHREEKNQNKESAHPLLLLICSARTVLDLQRPNILAGWSGQRPTRPILNRPDESCQGKTDR